MLDCDAGRAIGRRRLARRLQTRDENVFESSTEVVLSALTLVVGGAGCLLLGRWLKLNPLLTGALYVWHSALGLYYSNYILTNGGDAFVYYQKAKIGFVELDLGTDFIVWLSSFLTNIGFTYWSLALVYNIIGAVGVTFFYAALKDVAARHRSTFLQLLVLICVFVPSLSFWTSGIGKDSLAVLSVGLFLWAITSFERRRLAAIAAVAVMLPVRPHMAGLMVLSAGAGTLVMSNMRVSTRFSMAAIATAAAIFAIPTALSYVGTDRFASIAEYIADRQEMNMGGGSSIDITGMNPVMRMFSYLYRPLPNEASGFAQLAASLDNLFLILLTIVGVVGIIRAGAIRVFRSQAIALLYGIGGLIILSQVTANLGLATRQKWMVIPALMLVFVEAWRMVSEDSARERANLGRHAGFSQALQ
jgi:hypothetical protein